ncbi:uncharacterized protein [Nicotiana tomentosiformis]|uniref:uncharacterized protein n=1 Tax=Nicotiana tomentosiformis TaxID=4098 RepID=UPI00388C6E11
MESVAQAGVFPIAPAVSQVGGGAQTPSTYAPEQMAPIYQTPMVPVVGVVQPVIATQHGERPAISSEGLMRLDKFTKRFPIHFGGTPSEDLYDYLDRCHEVLHNMGIVKSNGVDFVVFQMIDSAKRWWQEYKRSRPTSSPPLTWDPFSQLFLEKFILFHSKRGVPLAVRAPLVGWHDCYPIQKAKETGDDISFQRAVEIARRIEMIRSQGRETVSGKRPHHFGGFSGALSRGRVPISATPLQSSYSGYLGRQGQSQLQQLQQPRECFECGSTGHIRRYCLRLMSNKPQQGSRAIILAPVAPPPAQPARGGGQAARDGGQVVRGGGHPVRGHPRGGGQSGWAQPHFYAFSARPEVESSDAVITTIIPVFHRDVSILFDPGSTYSYVSSYFASYLVMPRESLSAPICVSMRVGDSIIVDHVYRSCVVSIGSFEIRIDLLLLDMVDFDVILGMD